MTRKTKHWKPQGSEYATYIGRTSALLRGGRTVQIVGEASTKLTLVRAIGRSGKPVQFCVLTKNLGQPQPQLFD